MTVQSAESKVDVLIVGAGPAGVMCANALSLAGVNVRIVDERDAKVATGQADGIAPRTTEVFQSYGLADRLLREGCRVYMAAFYNPNETGGIELSNRAPDVTAPSARYPFELALHQGAIEAIFLDSMKTRGVEVQRSTRPTEIELSNDAAELVDPTSYPVKVTLERLSLDGTAHHEVVHAKFVLGADGAHSWTWSRTPISQTSATRASSTPTMAHAYSYLEKPREFEFTFKLQTLTCAIQKLEE